MTKNFVGFVTAQKKAMTKIHSSNYSHTQTNAESIYVPKTQKGHYGKIISLREIRPVALIVLVFSMVSNAEP